MPVSTLIEELKSKGEQKIKIAFADIDGILRGKMVHIDKFIDIVENSIGFCNVIFGWDSNDVCYDNVKLTGWHTGYPDAKGSIDLTTFRRVPWEGNIPFFLGDFSSDGSKGLPSCSRTLLAKIAAECTELGYVPLFAEEFEWFNFQETPESLFQKDYKNPQPLTPGMFGYSILRSSLENEYFNDLFNKLNAFDIPIEGMHTETGPGVYEAAIKYDTVLEAGDKATLFKTAVKEIAYKHNLIASFMAKWNKDLPGCGGHIHQSLWDKERNRNLFWDDSDKKKMSALLKSYIAGQLYCLPHILPMYAPTVNSYKRLSGGAWAPSTLTWGVENRTTALRVINSGMKYARLETRVAGADANPYLVMAAALASGLYGIRKNLNLEVTETIGNGYTNELSVALPLDLEKATLAMKKSELARELFGTEFVEHYTATREWEWRQFTNQVTDWEIRRYFEII